MKRIAILSTVWLAAACGSNNTGPNENPDANPNAPDANPNAPDANPNAPDANPNAPDANMSGAKPTIFTIVMENHDYNEIVSKTAGDAASKNAPYFNSLIAQGGLATAYKDTGHPSLPNYLNMVSGDNQYPGVVDLDPTGGFPFPVKKDNLGDQLTVANIKWRSYQESATSPCELAADSNGLYAPKHDGFLYFDNIQNRNGSTAFCKSISVNYASNFATDLSSNQYRYMWITPNLTDDGHDGSSVTAALKTSDTWLSNNLPAILNSDGYKAGGIVFITWDESEGRNGDDPDLVPMLILSPRLKTAGMKSSTAFTHSSYLATIEDLLGLSRLSTVTNTKSLMEFLN
jgi:acid phosphatase